MLACCMCVEACALRQDGNLHSHLSVAQTVLVSCITLLCVGVRAGQARAPVEELGWLSWFAPGRCITCLCAGAVCVETCASSAFACVLLPPCVTACQRSVHVSGNPCCWGRCPSLVRERPDVSASTSRQLASFVACCTCWSCAVWAVCHTTRQPSWTNFSPPPQPVPSTAHTCSPTPCWPNRSGPGCSPPFVGLSSHLPTQAGAPSCGRDLVFLCYLHSLVPVTGAHPSTAAGWEPLRHTYGVGQAISAGPGLDCFCKQAPWRQAACCCLGGLWCGVHITPGGVAA